MLHAAVRWPDMADATLWPMAVEYACYVLNHVPKNNGLSPMELVTRVGQHYNDLTNIHVWGAPAYVLDPALQDGKKIPKWRPRSRRGVFVGLSRKHASSIPLVLNCTTLAISAQFHVVFDDWFTSVLSPHQTQTLLQIGGRLSLKSGSNMCGMMRLTCPLWATNGWTNRSLH